MGGATNRWCRPAYLRFCHCISFAPPTPRTVTICRQCRHMRPMRRSSLNEAPFWVVVANDFRLNPPSPRCHDFCVYFVSKNPHPSQPTSRASGRQCRQMRPMRRSSLNETPFRVVVANDFRLNPHPSALSRFLRFPRTQKSTLIPSRPPRQRAPNPRQTMPSR